MRFLSFIIALCDVPMVDGGYVFGVSLILFLGKDLDSKLKKKAIQLFKYQQINNIRTFRFRKGLQDWPW